MRAHILIAMPLACLLLAGGIALAAERGAGAPRSAAQHAQALRTGPDSVRARLAWGSARPDPVRLPARANQSAETFGDLVLGRAAALRASGRAAATRPEGERSPTSIRGQLVDATGRPLASLPVFLVDPAARERARVAFRTFPVAGPESAPATTTDADGHFRLTLPSPRSDLELCAIPPDGPPWSSDPLPRADADLGTLVLPGSRLLRGSVTDEQGLPIAGARVLLRGEVGSVLEAATGTAGAFRALVPRGPVDLLVSAEGCATALLPSATDDARVVLERGEAVRGQVLAEEGVPLGQLRVETTVDGIPRDAAVARDGSFRLERLRAGATVVLRLRGAATAAPDLESALRYVEPVRASAGGAPVRFWIPRTTDVRLRLRDAETDAPLAADTPVESTLLSEEELLPLSLGPTVTLRGLPRERAWRVRIAAHGYREAVVSVPRRSRDAAAREPLDVVLTPLPTLRVRVLDRRTGEPVLGAAVSCGGRSVRADAAGRATVTRPSPGEAVAVHHPDYLPAEAWARADTEELVVRLDAAGRLELLVLDADGEALPNARISVRPAPAAPGSPVALPTLGLAREGREKTDAEGRATQLGLPPGEVEVRVYVPLFEGGPTPPALPALEQRVTLLAGERRSLTLQLPPRGRVRFEVRDGVRAVPGARLFLASRHGFGTELPLGRTDDGGGLALERLALGPAGLRVVSPDGAGTSMETVLTDDATILLQVSAP